MELVVEDSLHDVAVREETEAVRDLHEEGTLAGDHLPAPQVLSPSDVCLICESDEWTVVARPIWDP